MQPLFQACRTLYMFIYIYTERVYAMYSTMNDSEQDMRVTGATNLEEGHIRKIKLWNQRKLNKNNLRKSNFQNKSTLNIEELNLQFNWLRTLTINNERKVNAE